jgi:hypothetical protein
MRGQDHQAPILAAFVAWGEWVARGGQSPFWRRAAWTPWIAFALGAGIGIGACS